MPNKDRCDAFFKMLLNPTGVAYSILSAMPTAMIIADVDLRIRFANSKYLDLANCREDDLINKKLDAVRPDTNLQQVIETGQTRTDLLSKTISNAVVDMAIPIYYKGAIVGGVSFLKENQRVQQLNKNLMEALARNKDLSMELKAIKDTAYGAQYTFKDLIGKSQKFVETVGLAKKIAAYDADILIIGESGTGKELFSQAIHSYSPRSNMPFIPVNCSTFSPNLVESELFGYEQNSFTGAEKGGKPGIFIMANKGTVMLDEIGELPFDMQAKLLRVLQERKVRRVGGSVETSVDVRIIAATNKDLAKLVKEGSFREDLYYRLSMLTMKVPPLRERMEDIKLIADFLLKEWNIRYGRDLRFAEHVYSILSKHVWPGNIRELRNAVYFAAYTCQENIIQDIAIQGYTAGPLTNNIQADIASGDVKPLKYYTENYELELIGGLLKKHGDSLEAKKIIAQQLQISLPTLYNKLKNLEK